MSCNFLQNQVKTARVMVVGCGALGNEVLKNLVLMGVEHLVVVDFDIVEIGNLTRSVLFNMEDARARRRKVDVVAERLSSMNPAVEIKTIFGDVTYDVGLGLVRSVDVVIGCVDSRWARYSINRLCMRANKPWVDGGISELEGTARVFIPGKNCYACNLGPEGRKDLARRLPCSGIIHRQEKAGSAPTTSIIASIIGAVQVQEALKLIHPEKLSSGELTSLCGKMFYYEGEHLTVKMADFQAYDEDCAEHECWEPIDTCTLTLSTTVENALDILSQQLNAKDVAICLSGDSFVDYVSERANDSRTEVMLPARKVEAFLEQHPHLSGVLLSGLYQHEYRRVDKQFPYLTLSLGELGIPAWDVLHVVADGRDFYLEMSEV